MRSSFRLKFPASLLLVAAVVVATVVPSAMASDTFDLTPRQTKTDFVHITAELEVGGDLLVQSDDSPGEVDRDRDQDAEQEAGDETKLPMSVRANFQYDEWRVPDNLAEHWTDDPSTSVLGMRRYDQAEATIKIDDGGHTPQLPDERRLMLVRLDAGKSPAYCCPAGSLERDQCDLIDVVGNSLALPALLPADEVNATESWSQDELTMAGLLGLDSIAVCEVQSVVDKSSSKQVQVRVAGVVHGTIDGAATEIELQGLYRFDRQQRRITRFNIAMKEKRSVGHATPGLDVVAKLRLKIEPVDSAAGLGRSALESLASEGKQFDTSLSYNRETLGVHFQYDPHWLITSEERETVTLRRIGQGDLLAHCTITHLPQKSAGRQTSLSQFQKDVKFALRDNFDHFVKSQQWKNSLGNSCLGMIARGKVEEIPVEWHYYLVSDESGRQASLAITTEAELADRLDGADRQLVDALHLVDPAAAETVAEDQPAASQDEAAEAESAKRPTGGTRSRR